MNEYDGGTISETEWDEFWEQDWEEKNNKLECDTDVGQMTQEYTYDKISKNKLSKTEIKSILKKYKERMVNVRKI